MTLPTMTPVVSSNLHSVGHDGEKLYVRFKGAGGAPGRVYRYAAGAEHHDALLKADSPGRHFNATIKNHFIGEPVAS
jgi:hypothetical protein